MIIKRKNQQKKLESSTCGQLFDVVKTEDFSIVKSVDIGVTGKHYHKGITEVYNLIKGEIALEVKEKAKKEVEIKLKSGDALVLQPGDIHKITKASESNELIITCVPAWCKEDEIVIE